MKLSELIYNAQIAMERYGDIDVQIEEEKGMEGASETAVISYGHGETYRPGFIVRGDY